MALWHTGAVVNEHNDTSGSTPDTTPDEQTGWLAVPDIMELTGVSLAQVKTWLQDREIIGARRGPHKAVYVPASFLTPEGPLPSLQGTITVLSDGGYRDEEIIAWLLESDDTLQGGSAIESLRTGSKTEVRRRAQEMAL